MNREPLSIWEDIRGKKESQARFEIGGAIRSQISKF